MCIFCDIIDHKIPSAVVYEDDDVLAILNVPQRLCGHTLVMPKKHMANILEADEETVVKCMKVARQLAGTIVAKTGAAGCNILNNCGAAAGQSVDHLHFHIIPRFDEADPVTIDFRPAPELDLDDVMKVLKAE